MNMELSTISKNLDDILDRYQPMTEAEERAMISSCGDDLKTRNQLLVLHNLAFAIDFTKKYKERTESREDFIMRGVEGLCTAAERFDPSKGVRFVTFAGFYVQAAMNDLFHPNHVAPKTQSQTSAIFDAPIDRNGVDKATLGDYLAGNARPPDWNPASPDLYERKTAEERETNELAEYLIARFCKTDMERATVRCVFSGGKVSDVAQDRGIDRSNAYYRGCRVLERIRSAIQRAHPGDELYNVICCATRKRPEKIDADAVFAFMAGNDIIMTSDGTLEDPAERAERMIREYQEAELDHQTATGRLGGGADYDMMRMVYDDTVIHDNSVARSAERRGIPVSYAKFLRDKAVSMVKDHKSGKLRKLYRKGAEVDHAAKDELFNVVNYDGCRPRSMNYDQFERRWDSRKFKKLGRIVTWKRFGGGFYSHSNYLRLKNRESLGKYRISRREAVALAQFCEDVPAWAKEGNGGW